MEKIFNFDNPNEWCSHIESIMKKYIDVKIEKELLVTSNEENRFIDIDDIYTFTTNSIFNDIENFIVNNNSYIKLYHATATNGIQSYLEHGLCTLNSYEKNKYARKLFNQKEFPELTEENFNIAIEEHLNYLGMEFREQRISFMTNKVHLLENETQYLVYGSEYIFILAQRLGSKYKYFLKNKLKSTLLTCKVPIELLNSSFREMLIQNIIVKYVENIIYPEEIYKKDNYNYRNDAEIYINTNLEAKYIMEVEHPKNIIAPRGM